jgi:hypothetical protein
LTPGITVRYMPAPAPGDPDERPISFGMLMGLDVKNLPF